MVSPWIAQFAFGFFSVMLTSTVLGFVTMVLFRPRSWCVYCPMGTMTQGICILKHGKEVAVFDVGSHIVNSAASAITGSTSIDVSSTLQTMFNEQFSEMSIGELLGLGMETMIVSLCMKIMSVLITVILYGRMIEIYLYVSVAPVPCATVTNREWGTIGTNYFKGLCALAFQGFFMMVCVAIYAVLVAGVAVSDNLHTALWSVAAYTVILCFSLFKTGSLSKSIWNAH